MPITLSEDPMRFYQSFFFPFIKRVDPESAHHQTIRALELAQASAPGRFFLRQIAGEIPVEPIVVAGLTFPNILGVAAGFDKDVRVAAGLASLGFGHVEVGTLTPRPQRGNPRPRIFRLPADGALINRMGFPNCGVLEAKPRLQRLAAQPRDYILGISVGKQKETPLVEAIDDYLEVMTHIYEFADYLAINISSPNTPGLRELQGEAYISQLLESLQIEGTRLARQKGVIPRPLFLKISPDLTPEELKIILQAALTFKISGMIATNTTTGREGLGGRERHQTGGLSGRPLAERSTEIIRQVRRFCGPDLVIIGVGGVQTPSDLREKIGAGATLVQIYTALVYEGPGVAGRLLRRRAREMNWS